MWGTKGVRGSLLLEALPQGSWESFWKEVASEDEGNVSIPGSRNCMEKAGSTVGGL